MISVEEDDADVRGELGVVERWFDVVHWQLGKWVPEVVLVLIHGPARFQDLRRAVNAHLGDRSWVPRSAQLSNGQLSRTLQAMRRDELVLRHEDRSQAPVAVVYELSPLFRDFLTHAIGPAALWLRRHHTQMERIRERRLHRDH